MSSSVKLFLGPESGTKEERIKKEYSNLQKQYDNNVDFKKYYSFEAFENEMYMELNNPSLFSSHTLIVLYAVDQLNIAGVSTLLDYVKNPSNSSTLILESELFSLKSPCAKIASSIAKENTISFYPLSENELIHYVNTFFKSNNLTITREAVNLLLELVDNNTLELKIICNQLAFFFNVSKDHNSNIDELDIQKYVHHSKNENSFSLLEMILNSRLKEALEISHVLLERDPTFVYTLTGGILWGFRRLLSVLENLNEGESNYQAMQNASVFGVKKGIYRKDDITSYNNAIRNYSIKNTRNIISLLIDSDVKIRTNTGELLKLEIEQLLYNIIVKKGAKTLKFETPSLKNKL